MAKCSICTSNLGEDDTHRYCMHISCHCLSPTNIFHGNCIGRWVQTELSNNNEVATCPNCRGEIEESKALLRQYVRNRHLVETLPRSRATILLRLHDTVQFVTLDHDVITLDDESDAEVASEVEVVDLHASQPRMQVHATNCGGTCNGACMWRRPRRVHNVYLNQG